MTFLVYNPIICKKCWTSLFLILGSGYGTFLMPLDPEQMKQEQHFKQSKDLDLCIKKTLPMIWMFSDRDVHSRTCLSNDLPPDLSLHGSWHERKVRFSLSLEGG